MSVRWAWWFWSAHSGSATPPSDPLAGPPNLISHKFADGTAGPWVDFRNTAAGTIDYPTDPTGRDPGTVIRFLYSVATPGSGTASNDEPAIYIPYHHYRYGETLWFKGDVFIPSTLSDGVTAKTSHQDDDVRKLIDLGSAPSNGCRTILYRRPGKALYYAEGDYMNGGVYHEDVYLGPTGVTILDDTWYTIEVGMTMNSADNVRDGILDVYVNNSSATPDVHVTSGMGWITEAFAGGSYFSAAQEFGTQLSVGFPDLGYAEHRYWSNVAFSTNRIGDITDNYTQYDSASSSDTFTDTEGVLLSAHISDSGHVWYKQVGSNGTNALAITSGRVYNTATAAAGEAYCCSQRTPTADYTVEADFIYLTSDQTVPGVMARALVTANTMYSWYFLGGANNQWSLAKNLAGVATVLGSYNAGAGVYTANQTIHAKLVVSGTTITGYVAGVSRVSVTDSSIVARGHPGVRTSGGFTGPTTHGQQIDNFSVTSP